MSVAGRLRPPSFVGLPTCVGAGRVIAGLTVWAVLVPESLAYATIAGVPPVVGLYAAVPALALYALVGSSRHLVVVADVGHRRPVVRHRGGLRRAATARPWSLTAALALATGLVAMAAGLLRLGFLASFISEPVLKGFIIGLALTIMIGQLPAMLGVDKGSGNFFEKTWDLLTHLDDTEALAAVVGVGSLVVAAGAAALVPLLPGLPGRRPAGHRRRERLRARRPRSRHRRARSSPACPISGSRTSRAPTSSSCSAPRSASCWSASPRASGRPRRTPPARGTTSTPTVSSSVWASPTWVPGWPAAWSSTAACRRRPSTEAAGAKSQISGLTAAVLTVVTLLFLTGLFEKLPEATLAAVVVAAVIELVDIASLRRLWRVRTGRLASVYRVTSRVDFVAAAATLLGVLLFDTLPGLVIGIAVSLAPADRPDLETAHRGPGPRPPAGDARRRRPGSGSTPSATPASPPSPGSWWSGSRRRCIFTNADVVREQVRDLVATATPGRPWWCWTAAPPRRSTSPRPACSCCSVRTCVDWVPTLVLADDVGQVRDVLTVAEPDDEPPMYVTIEEAIAAASKSRDETGPVVPQRSEAD